MPFRDRAPACPRCRVDLTRADNDREAWRCPRCAGTALGVGDLIDDLLEVAPHLRPADGVRDLVTIARRAPTELACPVCGQPMELAYLAAVEVERCHLDNLVWLDRGERDTIVARAAAQPRSGPLEHLLSILVGPPTDEPQVSRASRVVRVVSAIAVLVSIPLGVFGARLLVVIEWDAC
jgi:Zn-finger nucleic acid-binding protein